MFGIIPVAFSNLILKKNRNVSSKKSISFTLFRFSALGDNFDLVFPGKTATDVVLLPSHRNVPDLVSMTLAVWVKADERYSNGTIFTYVVPGQMEEKMVILFSSPDLEVTIKQDTIKVPLILNDGKWHFIGVIWSGDLRIFSVYADGKELQSIKVRNDSVLLGGGFVALGQRHSNQFNTFLAADSFVGAIHQLNFWLTPGSSDHMWNAAHSCSWPIGGDVMAWIEFLFGVKGNVQKKFPSTCKGTNMPLRDFGFILFNRAKHFC